MYEIEIKSLLGSKESADRLMDALLKKNPAATLAAQSKQLNHYFNAPADLTTLQSAILPLITSEKHEALKKIVSEGKKVSVRTRETTVPGTPQKALFIIKASIGDDTSANGVSRIEFETPVQKILTELDAILLDAGCTYQAKWSREREEYKSGDTTMTIDKNAGYGYLAEFERIAPSADFAPAIEKELRAFMAELGAEELSQDRLERMFAFYNEHWPEYYGTNKVFRVE